MKYFNATGPNGLLFTSYSPNVCNMNLVPDQRHELWDLQSRGHDQKFGGGVDNKYIE